MDSREAMAAIEYRPGILLPLVKEGEEPPQIDVQVVRLDHGRLLVRLDEGEHSPAPGVEAELEVPTPKALVRLFASIEKVVRTQEGAHIAYLLVDEIDIVQRRKQDRFAVNFPCRFVPVKEAEDEERVRERPYGLGRVTNMSLGGLQFEAEYELPVGMNAYFDVRIPAGRLELFGRIVQAGKSATGGNAYGVKFTRVDNVTSQRLNRLILQLERRARLAREAARGRARSASPSLRRLVADRWESRDRRRPRRER